MLRLGLHEGYIGLRMVIAMHMYIHMYMCKEDKSEEMQDSTTSPTMYVSWSGTGRTICGSPG